MKTCVVIPAYNEGSSIAEVIKKVKKFTSNIVVVDDGSEDDTYESAQKCGVKVLKHIINLGKGCAAKTGCDYAYHQRFDAIILLDGDGQHDPKEIPNFIKSLKDVDIVFGYRTIDKKMPKILRMGNNFINLITKVLYGIKLHDTQGGYRAFKTNIYKKIRWQSPDYSMESEMIANVGSNNLRYKEIPIKTIYLNDYKGTTVLDGIKIVSNMIMWKLK